MKRKEIAIVVCTAFFLLVAIALVNATPTLTLTGFDADGSSMIGNPTDGYSLDTFNIASTNHLIQFSPGTISDEDLENNYFPLTLISSNVSAADLKAYYDARGVPEPFLTYLKNAVDGVNPFAYIKGDGTTNIKLIDSAKHDILTADTDMAIPDDYPLGTYTVQGILTNLSGDGNTTVTFIINIVGDRIPPIITQPNISLEATSSLGADATFPVSATDNIDGIVPVDCDHVSGSTFNIGDTTVYCNTSDSHGNLANITFNINVHDTTPPSITPQADIHVEATNSSGATAVFTVSATDIVDGITPVFCSQDSGVVFPFGTTTVTCNSSDTRNNTAQITFNIIVADTIAPVTTDNAPTGWWTSFYNITLSPTDAASDIAWTNYCINETDGCTPNINNTNINIFSDGIYYLKYQSSDTSGNTENIINKSIYVDTTAPNTTDNAPIGWKTNFYNITLSPTDNTSGVAWTNYCINETDGCTPNINNTNINIFSDGIYYLKYQSEDNAGNIEPETNKTIQVDTVSPNTTDNILSGWYNKYNVLVNITLYPNDTTSGIALTQYCIDQNDSCSPNMSYINGTNIIVNTDGKYYIRYYSTDVAGNIENIIENVTDKILQLDTVSPNTTDNAPIGWKNSTVNITLNPTDATSGIATTEYCIDQTNTCTPNTTGTNIFVNTDGINYIWYNSTDVAGNVETVKNTSVSIDTTAPTTIDNAPSIWINHTINVTLNATDLTTGVNWTEYCVAKTNNCTNMTRRYAPNATVFNISSEGIWYVKYHSADNLGNIENITNKTIFIDMSKPTLTTNTSGWHNHNVTVMLTSNDTLSGVNRTIYCTDQSNTCTPTISITNISNIIFNYSVEGTYYIKYTVLDNVGNNLTNYVSVGIDRNAPVTTDNAPNGIWQNNNITVILTATDTISDVASRSGVAWTQYCIDRTHTCTPNIIYNTSANVPANLEGTSYISYRSSDNAGNVNALKYVQILIDRTTPTLNVSSPVIKTYNATNIDLNFTVSEVLPGTNSSGVNSCWYVLDNIVTQNITGCKDGFNNITLNNLSETPHTIVVYAKDNVSNTISSPVISIAVSLSLPAPLIANSSDIIVNNTNDTIIAVPYGLVVQNVNVTSYVPEDYPATLNLIILTNTTSMGRYVSLSNDLTLTRNTTTRMYSVTIPAGTILSGPTNWDGILTIPTIMPSTGISPIVNGGMLPSISSVVDFGSDSAALTFDKAARIIITGYAGQMVGFVRADGTFVKVINTCVLDNQAIGNALPSYSECAINVGNDLVIWTKHFTEFVVYTQYYPPTPNTKQGGGSRSAVLECSDWSKCIDGTQNRTCAINDSISYPRERNCTVDVITVEKINENISPTPVSEQSSNETNSQKKSNNMITGGVVTDIEPLSIKNWMAILMIMETIVLITVTGLLIKTRKNNKTKTEEIKNQHSNATEQNRL